MTRQLAVSTRGLVDSSWQCPEPEKSAQKFEKYGMDFGPPRFGRLVFLVFLEAQLTTPNVILKAADYITVYLPIAAPIPYENPLD